MVIYTTARENRKLVKYQRKRSSQPLAAYADLHDYFQGKREAKEAELIAREKKEDLPAELRFPLEVVWAPHLKPGECCPAVACPSYPGNSANGQGSPGHIPSNCQHNGSLSHRFVPYASMLRFAWGSHNHLSRCLCDVESVTGSFQLLKLACALYM